MGVLGGLGMNSQERVSMTFMHEEPDRVPVFDQGIASNVASVILHKRAYTGAGGIGWFEQAKLLYEGKRDFLVERIANDTVEIYAKLDLDIVRGRLVPLNGPTKKLDQVTFYYEDKYGFWSIRRFFKDTSKTYMEVDSRINREGLPAIERYVEILEDNPVKLDERIFEGLDYIVEKVGQERWVTGNGHFALPFNRSWLLATVRRPDLIERYFDCQLKNMMKLIELEKKHGVDYIIGGGDLASNQGPVYPPRIFREVVLPRLKKLTSFCHNLGLPYMYHSDGYTWPIAKELFVESGVDGYGEIDAQAGMDLGEVKKRFPHLVLWGNVDCAKTLTFGPEEKVIAKTKECIEKAAPGGGYILGSSNTIHPNVPAKNFIAMLEAAKKYGSYPLSG